MSAQLAAHPMPQVSWPQARINCQDPGYTDGPYDCSVLVCFLFPSLLRTVFLSVSPSELPLTLGHRKVHGGETSEFCETGSRSPFTP
ncbi:hypothetical protein AAFF_G00138530 [Aldrovandia affinis]|uniref:Uncharacterized protein n=1 Tax=Aldrovandia affinis TaxID=143900 RepID=A0AAD7TBZ9_9TELE|nr:hypothetical protein AAFF_G00138530 [Aldrovandia affinis]